MDTPTAPLTRALIWVEIALVLGVSLGRSGVYATVNIVASLTAPEPLSSQTAVMNTSLAPDRPDETIPLTLIPYYAWAHRGAGEMTTWFHLVNGEKR